MKLSDQEFDDLRRLIQKLCGICLGDDKQYLIRDRLESVLVRNQLSSYGDLVQRVAVGDARLSDEIIEAITTNETSFNRDGYPFDELRRTILPMLIQTRMERQRASGLPFGRIRIWSAAASTGQEAYSVGIAILEYIDSQLRDASNRFLVGPESFLVVGTDISIDALQVAKEGKYKAWEVDRGLSLVAKKKYFAEHDGNFQVVKPLRSLVDFHRLNLVQPTTDASPFDLILCRNLLIYFDESTRKRVIESLIQRLLPGGVMILGAAESLSILPAGLIQKQLDRTVIYCKNMPA